MCVCVCGEGGGGDVGRWMRGDLIGYCFEIVDDGVKGARSGVARSGVARGEVIELGRQVRGRKEKRDEWTLTRYRAESTEDSS